MEKINIVTTTLNYLNCGLIEFLNNFYKNTEPIFHHTIIDQGSIDGTIEWLRSNQRQYKYDIVSFNENRGVSWAHNYVWRNYPGEHYLKLDPDVIIDKPGWLTQMVKVAEENPTKVGNIGLNFEPHEFNLIALSDIQVEQKNGNIGGACSLIPNYVNKELGYWDVLSELYGEEDALMGLRVEIAGRMNLYLHERMAHLISHETETYREFKNTCRANNLKNESEYCKRANEYHSKKRSLYVI